MHEQVSTESTNLSASNLKPTKPASSQADLISSSSHKADMLSEISSLPVITRPQQCQLEQLERLRSEDTPHRLMITHILTSSYY